ncbi:MAG: glycosyltransferase family 4 protein [Candidatus Nomurabacteria bacterium]|nr:MAG: glycosyltransferase family 4 protein [Candidatus Nomurabacteria bacterium]
MRIGIDCRTILNPSVGEGAGVGHYTYFLIKNLLQQDKRNEYVLFFDSSMKDLRPFRRDNATPKYFPFSERRRYLPFAYSHVLTARAMQTERLDLFHAPANIIPLGYTGPAVVTIHDLAIYKNPSWFPRQIFSTKLLVPKSLTRAERIIAVSESTAEDLRELFKVPSEKISVIYEGVDVRPNPGEPQPDPRERFNLPDDYLCFVGTLEPRKNLPRLIRAYAQALRQDVRFHNIPLVLAGKKGWQSAEVFAALEQEGIQDNVHYLGYISKNEKLELIRHARAFVFPSLYEGFGLPVIEAMALGTPVLTSDISSLPEITGGAAYLVDPEEVNAIANGLARLAFDDNLRQRLSQQGLEQARRFSWDKVALRTIAVYEKIRRAQ